MLAVPARTCALALAFALAACEGGAADRPTPPSVVLISLDTLRADRTTLHGHARDTTPFLAELAAESVVFERAIASAPWTLISHMTMLSGLNPEQHGVDRDLALSEDVPLLAERLRALGYRTIGLYRPGWIHERHGFARGFDRFRPHMDLHEAEAHLEEEIAALRPERPFLLFLHLFDVHAAPTGQTPDARSLYYDPDPPYDRMFQPDAPDLLAGLDWKRVLSGEIALDERQLEALRALYDGNVRMVDDALRRWFGLLRERGLLENALVVVTSDHGESLGLRDGRINGHGRFYQDGLWVPLLVRHPDGRGAGTRVAEPVSHVDLVPTILAAAGAPIPADLPGHALQEPPPSGRVLRAARDPQRARVQWPYKAWCRGDDVLCAFDLEADPGELRPLVDPAIARRLEEAAAREALASRAWPAPIPARAMDAETAADLEALGYAGAR